MVMRKLLGVSCSACVLALSLAGCDAESIPGQGDTQKPKIVFPPKNSVVYDNTDSVNVIFETPLDATDVLASGVSLEKDNAELLFYSSTAVDISQPITVQWRQGAKACQDSLAVQQSTLWGDLPMMNFPGEPVDIEYSSREGGVYILTTKSLHLWDAQSQVLNQIADVACNIQCQLVLNDSETMAYVVLPDVLDSKLITIDLGMNVDGGVRGTTTERTMTGTALAGFSRQQDAKWVEGHIVTVFHWPIDGAFSAQIINTNTASVGPFLNEELSDVISQREFQGLAYDAEREVGLLYSPKFSELIAWSYAGGQARVLGLAALDDVFMRDDGEDNSRFYWDSSRKRFYATNRNFSMMISVDAEDLMQEISHYEDVTVEIPRFNTFVTRDAERLMTSDNHHAVGFPSTQLGFGYAVNGVADAAINNEHQIAYRLYDRQFIAINLITGDRASIARFNVVQ